MTIATMPAADLTTDDQVAELEQRAANAYAIAETAERDGDAAKADRAMERYELRVEQARYVGERPADAVCPRCRWGEKGWSPSGLLGAMLWHCLAHWDGATAIVAGRLSDLRGDNDGAAVYAGEGE